MPHSLAARGTYGTLQELDETANSVNLPKQVAVCLRQIACHPVRPPGFHPEGLCAVPTGLLPLTFNDPALPCRATAVPSLTGLLPFRFIERALPCWATIVPSLRDFSFFALLSWHFRVGPYCSLLRLRSLENHQLRLGRTADLSTPLPRISCYEQFHR
jgi:hypothetical protein